MPATSNATILARQSFRVRELARLHNLAPSTIYSWISAGLLFATKVGGVVLVPVDAWNALMAKNRAN